MMRDINDILPKLPPNSLGLAMNWKPEQAELKNLVTKSPLPFDGRWHTLGRIPGHTDLVVDGKFIRRSDDSKLT